jgi:RNA recognition motif-containing protein
VGGLDWGTKEEDLKELFKSYGVTDAQVVMDRETGRSRGFGFVKVKDAHRAKNELDQCQFQGRKITVNDAKERDRDGGGSDRPRRSRERRPE